MDLGIRGKVAMVAAASRGLGQACAEALAREGCEVSICGRHAAALDAARLRLASMGHGVLAVPCDVSKAVDLERWFQATQEELGTVDILVTNTGGPTAATFLDLSDAQWAEGVESTLMNVVRLCRLVLPGMRARRWGRIVNITSLVAKQPLPLLTISSTLRAGLSALTRNLATECASDNVLVNALLPGHVMTDRQLQLGRVRSERDGISVERYFELAQAEIPARRFGQPGEIGDVAAFLCSERASYLTGASIQVDGGLVQTTL